MIAHHLLYSRVRYLDFVKVEHLVVEVEGAGVFKHALALILLDG